VRSEGRLAEARILSAEKETFLILRKRLRLKLSVQEGDRTYTGSAAALVQRDNPYVAGARAKVYYRPDAPERMAVAEERSVLGDALFMPQLALAAEAFAQLSILGLAWAGLSIFRRGRRTVGQVEGSADYLGLPLRTATIEVDGKRVSTTLAMPLWARQARPYLFAYLPHNPKKMVPIMPADGSTELPAENGVESPCGPPGDRIG
jgi:hypothetical protein